MSSIVLSPEAIKAAIVPHQASAEQMRAASLAIPRVDTPQQFEVYTDALRGIETLLGQLETERKNQTKAATDFTRNVNAFYAMATKPLHEASAHLRRVLGEFKLRENAARVQQAQAGMGVHTPPAEVQGFTVTEVTIWEITNADAVPRQFCSPDPMKIKAHLDNGGLEAIPGIKFSKAPSTRVTKHK